MGGRTVEVVGFGRRLIAYLVDSIILGVIGFACSFAASLMTVGFTAAGAAGSSEELAAVGFTTAQALSTLLGILIGVSYYVFFWTRSGQTPGKMIMDVKVVRTDGTRLSVGQAFLRYIGYIVSGLVLALGFLWIAFDRQRQGWHDKIADTVVVRGGTHFEPGEPVTFVPSDGATGGVIAIGAALLLCVLPVLAIAALTILGPQIGNVFSEIQSFPTPGPSQTKESHAAPLA
ncbi:MAG TPA: RDD family protein [Ardenticatenaceae bacterium]|nr:RDD family protein [Ardenticatenaceae bacterium]